jgi:hypothetical protein
MWLERPPEEQGGFNLLGARRRILRSIVHVLISNTDGASLTRPALPECFPERSRDTFHLYKS